MSEHRESAHERGLDAARRRAALAREKSPRVLCECCDGSGLRKLGVAHAETWGVMTSDWQTTTALNKLLPRVKTTALINRLQELKALGLVENRLDPQNYRRLEWRRRA